MPEIQKLAIKFVANRDTYQDSVYSTGAWDRDEVKLIEPTLAAKMIRHVDVFQRVDIDEAVAKTAEQVETVVKKTQDKENDDATADLRDQVNRMTRDQAIEYAAVHYQLKIPGNASVDTARAALIQHIDLAGPL